MFFLSNFSLNRHLFFFYLFFIYFFVYRSFHAITEEVCVSICVVGFICLLLYYMTGKGLLSFQKSWYRRFLEKIDLVLLSLATLHGVFSYIFSNKVISNFNLLDFYKFFLNFYKKNIFSYFTFCTIGFDLFYSKTFVLNSKQILGKKQTNPTTLVNLLD